MPFSSFHFIITYSQLKLKTLVSNTISHLLSAITQLLQLIRISMVAARARFRKIERYFNAASNGYLIILKHLAKELDNGEGLKWTYETVRDHNGKNALHFAAAGGQLAVCDFLVNEMKLDLHSKDRHYGYTALHHAVRAGRISTARYLIQIGAPVSLSCLRGWTPLHEATHTGNVEMMELLVSSGADVESISECDTPLHLAAAYGRADLVECLLNHKANPNSIGTIGTTPLLLSISAKSLECVKRLLKAGADPNLVAYRALALILAIRSEKFDMVLDMQEHMAVVDMCGYLDLCDHDYFTPLTLSIMADYTECLHLLLEARADPNIGACGITPLSYAAGVRKPRMVELLLEYGADPNVVGSAGMPIEFAAANHDDEIMGILLPLTSQIDSYPDWSIRGITKYADLFMLAYRGYVSYLMEALGARDPLKVVDANKRTLLHIAAAGGNINVIQFLVKVKYFPIDTTDIFGWTPLSTAVNYKQYGIVDRLIKLGADINMKSTTFEFTALHVAAYRGDGRTVKLLAQRGIDLGLYQSVSPCHLAILKGHIPVVHFIFKLEEAQVETFAPIKEFFSNKEDVEVYLRGKIVDIRSTMTQLSSCFVGAGKLSCRRT